MGRLGLQQSANLISMQQEHTKEKNAMIQNGNADDDDDNADDDDDDDDDEMMIMMMCREQQQLAVDIGQCLRQGGAKTFNLQVISSSS